jgi:hypothetical protein
VFLKGLVKHRKNIIGAGAFNLSSFNEDPKINITDFQTASSLDMDNSTMIAGGRAIRPMRHQA